MSNVLTPHVLEHLKALGQALKAKSGQAYLVDFRPGLYITINDGQARLQKMKPIGRVTVKLQVLSDETLVVEVASPMGVTTLTEESFDGVNQVQALGELLINAHEFEK